MSNDLLTEEKQKWADRFNPNHAVGSQLNYSAAIQSRYISALNKIITQMMIETEQEIKTLFSKPEHKEFFAQDASTASQARIVTNALIKKFENLFDFESKILAEKMIKETDNASKVALKGSLKELSGGLTLKTDVLSGQLKETISASITQNVSLIRSIAPTYLGKVQTAVMRSITTGNGLQDLVPFFRKQRGITYRHAKNMALDQTRKAYSHINLNRMSALGVEEFQWIHSGGGQNPRKLHQAMNGKIYKMNEPPIIDEKTGERGYPADAINCKCVMKPVIKFKT